MNLKIIKTQLINNIISYKFMLVIIISFILSYINIITSNNWELLGENNFLLYTLDFNTSKGTGYYLIILPFLAAFLGGGLIGEETRSNRQTFILSRISKINYLRSSLFSSFFLGGIGAISPMLTSLLCSYLKLPYFNNKLGDFEIFSQNFWGYSIFESNPLLCILLLLLIIFIFGGLFSNSTVIISYIIPLKIVENLFIFFFIFITTIFLELINMADFSPSIFLNFPISGEFPYSFYALISYIVLLSLFIYFMTRREAKADVFNITKKNTQ